MYGHDKVASDLARGGIRMLNVMRVDISMSNVMLLDIQMSNAQYLAAIHWSSNVLGLDV